MAAFTAIYLSLVVAGMQLVVSGIELEMGFISFATVTGVVLLIAGFGIVMKFAQLQRDSARATVRLQFFEDALKSAD